MAASPSRRWVLLVAAAAAGAASPPGAGSTTAPVELTPPSADLVSKKSTGAVQATVRVGPAVVATAWHAGEEGGGTAPAAEAAPLAPRGHVYTRAPAEPAYVDGGASILTASAGAPSGGAVQSGGAPVAAGDTSCSHCKPSFTDASAVVVDQLAQCLAKCR